MFWIQHAIFTKYFFSRRDKFGLPKLDVTVKDRASENISSHIQRIVAVDINMAEKLSSTNGRRQFLTKTWHILFSNGRPYHYWKNRRTCLLPWVSSRWRACLPMPSSVPTHAVTRGVNSPNIHHSLTSISTSKSELFFFLFRQLCMMLFCCRNS